MRGRPFEKGRSGNPGGRPKVSADLRDLAREHAPAAIDELARLALKARSEPVRIAAIRELFDRGYGKPASSSVAIELAGIGEWDGSDAVLCGYRAIIEAVAGGRVSSAEGLELVALIEAQRAVVEKLRPAAMSPQPTPEQLAEQKRRDEAYGRVFEQFQAACAI